MTYSIRPLDADARTADFKCGELALDEYLQRYASQDIKRGIARVFVASPTQQLQVVSGFYTLSAASIAADTLPEKWRKKLPRYPVPIALLGRLAVGQQYHGQGLGSILLADACKRVAAASETLAVAAIAVDAKSRKAAAFYQHFGFIELPGQPGRWMLSRPHFSGLV
ncbi:GNAT family N-acetyltransferase [Ectothiorhodospira haloalkaliphila]|uniref:GNAT family N-acetyltransferase n=1 Tax=Ectothiorhodospira haloalkaliphila TaxID=421628 RepID=UPI001EE8FBD5|nr:GNAT family N-acetyltransferase [Ectothiorhodospira haloalkaliphila]MCG5526336.1 GNAT family N-acetyltransferase [Ectothiorhodospira haloalkaliphila]